ncbi:unnamed protein product [Adineta ricciae]|uniref:Glycoside hydrolase family 125 protein n=2 Tax=Adineta ricciae TaxID=249248 RepID=A0A814UXJ5_ADIRI|nr:unnamed protein product [Adineta ricciae]
MMVRRRPYLFIIGFLLGVPSITTFIRILLHPSSNFSQQTFSLIHEPKISFPSVRPTVDKRRFNSSAVEALISEVKRNIKNTELAWLFENCFPNTLDTTVDFTLNTTDNNRPDTYVITGDIDAMWLRDSSAQVHPYLPLMKHDANLRLLIEGVLLRQLICIQRDPYANAFYKTLDRISEWKYVDDTDMNDGVHERKWELDSLCYVIRLMFSYWKEVDYESTFFRKYESDFKKTIRIIVDTLKLQQRYNGSGSYRFQRQGAPSDPRGNQARPNGLIYSYFRPSDDLQIYPYLIPAQFFAYHSLKQLLNLTNSLNWADEFRLDINNLITDLRSVLFGIKNSDIITMTHPKHGLIYLYESNGFGGKAAMDDANIPSLLSLPYLCPTEFFLNRSIYQNTRKFVLSKDNPWFMRGNILEGVGGPHIGYGTVWPLAIIMRGLTSNDDEEIRSCLRMLQKSHSNTGYMHEAISVDDPTQFTRPWFAWANSLFGEFVWKIYREKRYLLNEIETRKV